MFQSVPLFEVGKPFPEHRRTFSQALLPGLMEQNRKTSTYSLHSIPLPAEYPDDETPGYQFTGPDGNGPYGGVTLDSAGDLLGTAETGGA